MKSHLILTTSIAALTLTTTMVHADQTQLNAGDIVFLAGKSDTPDSFSFSPLVNIEAGTYIFLTDNGRTTTSATSGADWRYSAGDLALGEGIYTYVAPSNLSAGTVVTLAGETFGLGLATGGDNLLAYQGSIRAPRFIAGLGWAIADPFITTGTASSNNSYLPSTLALGTSAVEITANLDNTGYTGTTTGTQAALLTAVHTAGNWTNNDTAGVTPPASLPPVTKRMLPSIARPMR